MVAAVAPGDIGNVPDGVGSGTVLDGGAGHGVGEFLGKRVGRVLLVGVLIGLYPLAVLEHAGINLDLSGEILLEICLLTGEFSLQVLLVYGIQKA